MVRSQFQNFETLFNSQCRHCSVSVYAQIHSFCLKCVCIELFRGNCPGDLKELNTNIENVLNEFIFLRRFSPVFLCNHKDSLYTTLEMKII
jgi:hypothetical protein